MIDKPRIANSCICCENKELLKSSAILMPFIADRVFGWKPVEITQEWGLKSIKQGMAYSICNSLQCTRCNHLFLDIRFNNDEMALLYDGYRGKEYTELREYYELGYSLVNTKLDTPISYIKEIEDFIMPYLGILNNILDYGGDTGKNTPFKDKKIFVYDISNKDTIDGVVKVDKYSVQSQRYDLIVCSQVLEHIPFPTDIISEIVNLMNNETLLYIEVPYETLVKNIINIQEMVNEKKYWHEHINFFTEKSLMMLLTKCNLDVLKIKTLEVNVGENVNNYFQVVCKLRVR